ncbi:MAG: hypothetical protein AB1502_11950 [Thermodesulfobacteriota bacterium]
MSCVPLTYIMAFVYRNWKIEKGSYRIRERNLRKIFQELEIQGFRISRKGMTIYGLGETVYKLTSLGERFLSRIRFLNTFSGYCYFTGRKS